MYFIIKKTYARINNFAQSARKRINLFPKTYARIQDFTQSARKTIWKHRHFNENIQIKKAQFTLRFLVYITITLLLFYELHQFSATASDGNVPALPQKDVDLGLSKHLCLTALALRLRIRRILLGQRKHPPDIRTFLISCLI